MNRVRLTKRGRYVRNTLVILVLTAAFVVGLFADTLGLVEWWK